MAERAELDVRWYEDSCALSRGEPGLYNSYVASLASCLTYLGRPVDPVEIMGASAWAFRIIVNEVMCPSAGSVFDWCTILPETVRQAGYECTYVSRLWHEGDREEERRCQAEAEIVAAIERGIPAISWDIGLPEWGLITGYDARRREYITLSCLNRRGTMRYDDLGRREIKILSVTVPGRRREQPPEETFRKAIAAAVAHADGQEWTERPAYLDGPAAFELWAGILQRQDDPRTVWDAGRYYAGLYYGARCYARDYLRRADAGTELLAKAADAYDEVATCLKPVWEAFSRENKPDRKLLPALSDSVRRAGGAERRGLEFLRRFLER